MSVSQSVSMSVCQYVRDGCPAQTKPTNFLIFGIKVGDQYWRKITEPFFPGKFVFPQIWAFRVKFYKKQG